MASGSFNSSTGVGLNLYVEWSSTTNVAGNYSTVTMKTYLKHYSLYVGARSDAYVKCDGQNHTYSTAAISYSGSSQTTTTLLSSKSFTVYHNSDGTKSITLEAGWRFSGTYSGQSISWIKCSKTVTLDDIPRASSITSAGNVTLGNACSVKWTPNASTFKFKVKFTLGNYDSGWTSFITPNSTNAYTYTGFTIPLTVANQLPKNTTGTMTVYLATYNSSGTQIGSNASKTFTVTVPSTVVPSISAFTATRVNNEVPSSWGIYVQGKSQCTLAITAAGSYGSTISSYQIKQGSTVLASASSVTTAVLMTIGTITYTATVTDSRGRTATKTVSISVSAYTAPWFSQVLSQRCLQNGTVNDDGTYIRAFARFGFSEIGNNNLTATVAFKKPTDENWSTEVAITSGTAKVIAGSANIDSSYQVMYKLVDQFNTIQYIDVLSTAFTTMDYRKGGKAVAIGKVSEYDNLFDVGLPSKFRNGLILVDSNGNEYDVLAIIKNL